MESTLPATTYSILLSSFLCYSGTKNFHLPREIQSNVSQIFKKVYLLNFFFFTLRIKHVNEAGFPQCWRLLEILKVFRNRRKNALEKVKIQSSSSSSSSSSANINIKYLRFSMLHMEIIFELYQITWTIAMITLISELFIHYRLMSRLISNMNRLFNHITNQYDRHG